MTTRSSTDLWLGLYTDTGLWHWSESHGGNIQFGEIPTDKMAVILQMTDLSLISTDINVTHSFACEKAAPSEYMKLFIEINNGKPLFLKKDQD